MAAFARLFVICLFVVQVPALLAATEQEERLDASTRVLHEILDTPDNSIPKDLLEKAECIGIIPSVKKFAFGLGGRYGAGYVLCKKNFGKGDWGAPSAFMLGGGSIGFQLGFSATDYVLLFMNHYGVEKLLQDKFTLGGDATVAGGPVGRSASAATDAQMTAQILSYSRSKGLFAGISLEGAVMQASAGDNKALYGKDVSPKDILVEGSVPAPASAQILIQLLSGQAPPKATAATPAEAPAAASDATASPKTGPGSLAGTVHDISGAVVPDAVITVTNAQSNASRWVTADAQGHYSVPGLDPGSYVVKAQASGMKAVTTSAVSLEPGADQVVDFHLEAGQ